MFLKLGDSFYNSMLLITSAPQAIPMQGPLVSQARWPMVYFVSFLFIGRVLLFKLITVSSMQIFKFTIEDAYLKRLSHRKRSARISFQMLKQDNVVSLETWRNIYITWHEHDVGFVRTSCFFLTHSYNSSLLYPRIPPLRLAVRYEIRIQEYRDPECRAKRVQFRRGIANKLFRDVIRRTTMMMTNPRTPSQRLNSTISWDRSQTKFRSHNRNVPTRPTFVV